MRPLRALLVIALMLVPASAPAAPPRPPVPVAQLEADARRLFQALQQGDAEQAAAFFLPREVYAEVKAVKDPEPHYRRLLRAFRRDVALVGKEHPGLARAELVAVIASPRPRWMAPGREVNRVGYYVRYRTKLRYRLDGRVKDLEVRVMIDAGGRWSISHLRPFR